MILKCIWCWLPCNDAPILAMERDFRDFCLQEYGVIAIPKVSYRLLIERDQFMVIASNGVCPLNKLFRFKHFLIVLAFMQSYITYIPRIK